MAKAAINKVHSRHEERVMDVNVRIETVQAGEGLHLAADSAYDSRGYSALIGKVVLSDTLTKLILRTEVLHRSETGNSVFLPPLLIRRKTFQGV